MVDRSSDPAQGYNLGMLRFDADNPAAPPEILSSVDQKTILMLKAYIKKYEDELSSLSSALNI
jgi:hypothetical protein